MIEFGWAWVLRQLMKPYVKEWLYLKTHVVIVTQSSDQAGLAASYDRAFAELGLKTSVFDLFEQRLLAIPLVSSTSLAGLGQRLLSHLDLRVANRKANRRLVRHVTELQPALVVAVGGDFFRAASLLSLRISVPGIKLVNIFPDMVFNLDDNILMAMPLYDKFYCHTRTAVPFLREMGAKGASYLPFAVDTHLHPPVSLTERDIQAFCCDVTYVGNYRPEYEEYFDALRDFDVAIWGPPTWGRARSAWVRSCYKGRALMGLDYARANRVAKVSLNPIDPLDLPGHNMRTFELPGCGAFSIMRRTAEILELFREGDSIVCFDNASELREKVDYYLARPDARARIAAAGHEHVVQGGHTYVDRARGLLRELDLSGLAS